MQTVEGDISLQEGQSLKEVMHQRRRVLFFEAFGTLPFLIADG
jgi:hypothetical protein